MRHPTLLPTLIRGSQSGEKYAITSRVAALQRGCSPRKVSSMSSNEPIVSDKTMKSNSPSIEASVRGFSMSPRTNSRFG